MLTTLTSHALGLLGRAVPVLLALQDAPRPSGGAPASGGGGGAGGGAGGAFGGGSMNIILLVALPLFMYFAIIRPANKQRKEQETLQKGISKGDKVVTTSGILGTVTGLEDQFVTLEISERVRVKFLRDAIARKFDPQAASAAAKPEAKAGASTTTTADAKK
jgi:preprotein translocase subunit YajC